MGRVVHAVMASHTTLMNTRWQEVAHLQGPIAFRNALQEARKGVERSGAETAIIIGPNHFRGMWLDLMPAFTIGVGVVIGAGEHGTPAGPQTVDSATAHHLLEELMHSGFDPAFSDRLEIDHGITHAIQYVVPDGMPVVPVVINSFAAPLPSLDRCHSFGASVGAAVASFAEDRKVAIIASGGLSHTLPFPDWRAPQSDDDDFLVDSWREGRDNWKRYEERRRSIVVSAPAVINEAFDRDVLEAFASGDSKGVARNSVDLAAAGGNGANEIRNWIAAAAACGSAPTRTLCYAPVIEWLTGMAVAEIDRPTQIPPHQIHRQQAGNR